MHREYTPCLIIPLTECHGLQFGLPWMMAMLIALGCNNVHASSNMVACDACAKARVCCEVHTGIKEWLFDRMLKFQLVCLKLQLPQSVRRWDTFGSMQKGGARSHLLCVGKKYCITKVSFFCDHRMHSTHGQKDHNSTYMWWNVSLITRSTIFAVWEYHILTF